MAGTLVVTTIESAADETPPVFKDLAGSREIVQGCWAWCNLNGTGTIAVRDSFNISSVTDGGTGVYTFNFNTTMPNANYVLTGAVRSASVVSILAFDIANAGGASAGNAGIRAIDDAGTLYDTDMHMAVFCNP